MDSSLYFRSKISPPRLPRIYPRQRLIKRLKDNRDKKICFIIGQAAQGKSTLAVEYLHECSMPWAWLNLSTEDSDPVNLFYALAQALRPGLSPLEVAGMVERPSPQKGLRAEIPLFRGWSASLFSLAERPLLLVLDGLDRLDEAAPSFQFLRIFGEEAPEGIYLQMLSRAAPPLNLQELKVRREAFILDNKELSFTTREIKGFFKSLCGLSLSSGEIGQIQRVTEGWAGGLILLSEHLKKTPEENWSNFLSEKMEDGLKLEFHQYFADTIFTTMSEGDRDFLYKSSMFEVIDPGLMAGLDTTLVGPKILEDLAQRNMFVSLISDKRTKAGFRLHQLFREFLQDKFVNEVGREKVRYWKSQAGDIMQEAGDFEQALGLFIQAKEYSKAAAIVHSLAFHLYMAGRIGDLERWIESLPVDLVDGNPWLSLYQGMINRFKPGIFRVIDTLSQTLEDFKKNNDLRGVLLSLTVLAELSLSGRVSSDQFNKWLNESEEWLSNKALEAFPYERTLLSIYIGLAHVVRKNLRKGALILKKAYPAAVALEQPFLIQSSLIQAGAAAIFSGELQLSEDLHKKIAELLEKDPDLFLMHQFMSNRALEHIYKGEKEKARELIRQALSHAEDNGLLSFYVTDVFNQTYWSAIFEDMAGLEKNAEQLLEMATSNQEPFFQALSYGCLGYGYYRTGQWSRALEFMDKGVKILSSYETDFKYHLSHMHVVRNLIASRLPGCPIREEEMMEALEHFRDVTSPFLITEVLLAQAIIRWRQGRTDEAGPFLKEGFELSQGRSHHHFIMLSRTDAACACALVLEMGIEEAEDYATFLLTTSLAESAGSELERLRSSSDPRVGAKAFEIKQKLHRAGIFPLRIKTLGEFQVYRGREAIENKDWGGLQSQTMLKALLSLGPMAVPKEQLMECLWPEVETSVQKKNFKVALHRLRKALEPEMDKTFGSSYLHISGSQMNLNPELCQIDLIQFYDLIAAGNHFLKNGDKKAALKNYSQAADLYQGDFLADDQYNAWAQQKRDNVKAEYLNLLLTMAKLHEDGNANARAVSCYLEALAMDTCLEEACQRVMILYDLLGKRNMAENVYQKFRLNLWEKLECEPDELTNSIYKRIQKHQ